MAGNLMSAQVRRLATLAAQFRMPSVAVAGERRLQAFATVANTSSVFEKVQQAPEDPILGVRLSSSSISIPQSCTT